SERNSRERDRGSTLAVPEQQRPIQHRSRSVSPHREDTCRARSRPPHVPMQRSLDEIHHNRHHSRSPSHYHESSLEHQRSGDSDFEYSEDSEILEMHRSVRGGSAECLHTNSSTLPACLKSKPYTRQEGGATLPRSILTHRVLRFTDEVTVSDLQPSLDRVRSASTTCLRPDTNFHSSDRDRAHPHCSPSPTVISGHRGRQLPQLPAKSSSIEQALAVEERARQLPMKVHSYRPSASHDSQKDLQTKREMYAEQRRSSDNMSARSSDSDMSDVSALSRASSASRLSSTSYMSIQSERPGGRLRSVFWCLHQNNI
ncbi:hypothetical protein XENORESO_021535, partial [Xenotaenia resolanae]